MTNPGDWQIMRTENTEKASVSSLEMGIIKRTLKWGENILWERKINDNSLILKYSISLFSSRHSIKSMNRGREGKGEYFKEYG